MTPPKPPRKSLMKSTITCSSDGPQSAHEVPAQSAHEDPVQSAHEDPVQSTHEDPVQSTHKDPAQSAHEDPVQSAHKALDASVPGVTDGGHSEVKVKPVPRPRSKFQSKTNSTGDGDTVNTTSDTTITVSSHLSENSTDYKRPRPVRPPPRPPLPTAPANGGPHYINSNTVKTPVVSTEGIQCPPPRPEPPRLPSCYYGSSTTTKPNSESSTDESQDIQESQELSNSSMEQAPVSPTLSEEAVNLYETYDTTATDKPAFPPRPDQPYLPHFASVYETSPPQTRPPPPPPPDDKPPSPSSERPSESVYSVIEYRPYLDVLPEDEDTIVRQMVCNTHSQKLVLTKTKGRSTLGPGQHYQSPSYAFHQQATEEINVMLRWLKRVSKYDSMAPSLYGLSIEEEIRSFSQRAMDVKKALRLYNLLMMKRHENLRDIITEFFSISHSLDKMQKKTKTMNIAGGTTGAVGGVAAVLGIALAPVTLGTSLIATAVGAGMVASAGGMGAHTAKANKKIVNKMTVEKLVYEYKAHVVDLELCLDFILCGMNELRRHDIARLQRAGAEPDALKMAHLSHSVFMNNRNKDRKASVTHTGGMSSERLLQAFAKEMDQYFTDKEGQPLKKSNKGRFSGRIRLLAENLQDELDHLNHMWEMFS